MITHTTPLADWLIVLPVVLCLLGGAVLLVLRAFLRLQPLVCGAVVALVVLCDGLLLQRVLDGGPLSMTMGRWMPPFGISFTADVMGAGFALLAAFVSFAVVLYLESDSPESARRDGLYPLLLLLLAGVSGAFLTGDLFNLYVWFEVMLIASFGLIVLAGSPLQLDGAVKYGVLNFIATTLFLAALGLLYGLLGTLNMADIIGRAGRADPPALAAVAGLFAVAFGMKAALFPVNAWLPASYHTPPVAISALMGALLTKVGVYAFIRVLVMLLPEARDSIAPAITAVGVATMLLGPLGAIAETNLRRAIGFMLIGGIGLIVISVPEGHFFAISGAIFYIAHAMLSLAALYLVAGLIERATGHFDSRDMAGIFSSNSLISWLFLLLILAISGVPPFLGFWPKLLLLQGFIANRDWLVVFALLLNALLTLIAGTRLWSRIFWRPGPAAARPAPQASAAALLLTGTVFLLGLWPNLVMNAAGAAATSLLDPSHYVAAVELSP